MTENLEEGARASQSDHAKCASDRARVDAAPEGPSSSTHVDQRKPLDAPSGATQLGLRGKRWRCDPRFRGGKANG